MDSTSAGKLPRMLEFEVKYRSKDTEITETEIFPAISHEEAEDLAVKRAEGRTILNLRQKGSEGVQSHRPCAHYKDSFTYYGMSLDNVPGWANWVAMDNCGAVYVYEQKPFKARISWDIKDIGSHLHIGRSKNLPVTWWKETLRKLPLKGDVK